MVDKYEIRKQYVMRKTRQVDSDPSLMKISSSSVRAKSISFVQIIYSNT